MPPATENGPGEKHGPAQKSANFFGMFDKILPDRKQTAILREQVR
jgi:hypothetical protein